jgi:YjjG family noncanonical pyrimidine nucleotidase
MKFQPKALFFDWDHTIWDHDLNAKEVLLELFEEFQLIKPDRFEEAFQTFHQINDQLWDQYQAGEISQHALRETRFIEYFSALKVEGDVQQFSAEYLYRTPRKTHLMPGASEMIALLSSKYPLYILTNGFDDIQYVKVEGSGIGHHFQQLITSQQVGTKKPDARFFEYALQQANCQAKEVLMIGDHLVADVQGAENAGIAAIHLDVKAENLAKRKIGQLNELVHFIHLD